jgi:phage terminase large subunit-like protein
VGQALVRDVLMEACGAKVRVVMRNATTAKQDRAQPVSAMYERGRVRHVRVLKELEDQMCAFGAERVRGGARSPDRVDALVWAVDALTHGPVARPGILRL